jgi:Uma2 family endonuclease
MGQPEERNKLDNGVVVAMAPERVNHARAKGQAWLMLRTAIAGRGLACEALPDGMAVRVDDRTVYEPDAFVRCVPPAPGDATEVTDPVVVVEEVSPLSRGIDRGVKLARYFSLPSVRHYLIFDTKRRVVIHHRRDDTGGLVVRVADDGPLALDPPGLEIAVRDAFEEL